MGCGSLHSSGTLTAFLVWIKTVPGPVNLHTSPSPEARPEMMPPEATLSSTYLVFHASRCPLSTMYFSPSTSCLVVSERPCPLPWKRRSWAAGARRRLARANSRPFAIWHRSW